MKWEIALKLIGQIYDRLLVEYPNAVMEIDTARLVRVQFGINTSSIDRSGTELNKVVCFTIDELLNIQHADEWATYMAQKLISGFSESVNKLNSSRRSSFHG